ncbi:MAG: acyl-ACP--UDP-N-acetylglucosamine O-acyltransferase [Rhizobiaceae bacterium]|nr:acyl-ACP--UDP-N-acetylglucosamine O-acyltransferase [Rhizobiaceae bacterium]
MSETSIHPTAFVERGASLGSGVRIGPFCHVGSDVVLHDDVELIGHVTVTGATTLGRGTRVHPTAVLGGPPQSARHKGGRTTLIVGENCLIREGVTMNVGTDQSRGVTRVGNNGSFFAYTHIAHDCIVGDNVVFANNATLAGHCEVGNFVNMGGLSAAHQFVRIGDYAFIGGFSGATADVIPYGMVTGPRGKLRGLNVVGMKRSGLGKSDLMTVRKAYKLIFDASAPVVENVARLPADLLAHPLVARIVDFLHTGGKRRFTVPPIGRSADDDDDEG